MTKQRQAWGYFASSVLSAGLGVFLLTLSAAAGIPSDAKLEKISGKVETIVLVDDLSDKLTPLPAFNAIHFTLAGNETLFRYPNKWPGYNEIYHRLAFEIDVWVNPRDLGNDDPVLVYRLQQKVPEGWAVPPISISYAAIAEAERASRRSFLKAGIGLMVVALVLSMIGVFIRQSNRKSMSNKQAE